MQSTAIKTLRSRQRFPNDPQDLVELTKKQQTTYNAIQSSIKRFNNHFSLFNNSYHQLLDDLLQCLDLSWESTSEIDATIAGIVSSLKDCSAQLNQTLSEPIKEQLDKHKSLQSQLDQWKSHSSKLDRRLKTLESAQTKGKGESKLEKAKYRAEDAATTCQEDAGALCPALTKLNAEGVQACCKTWLLMSASFSKLNEELNPLFSRLTHHVKTVYGQATSGYLPAWTETSQRTSRLRVSTLNCLNSQLESETSTNGFRSSTFMNSNGGSIYEQVPNNDVRSQLTESIATREESIHSILKRRPMPTEHNRKSYQPLSRTARSSDWTNRAPSMTIIRSNSIGDATSSSEYESHSRNNDALVLRSKSVDRCDNLDKIYGSTSGNERIIQLPPRPVERNHVVANTLDSRPNVQSIYSENAGLVSTPKAKRCSIVYEPSAHVPLRARDESPNNSVHSATSENTIRERPRSSGSWRELDDGTVEI